MSNRPVTRYVVYDTDLMSYYVHSSRVAKWDRPARTDRWGSLQDARVFTGKSAAAVILRERPTASLVEVQLERKPLPHSSFHFPPGMR